jgi:alpha-tubulin suppressor-like RCC1 family protein
LEGHVELEGASTHEGVTLSLSGTDFQATSAKDGAFSLESLPTGSYTLSAHKEGYADAQASVVISAGGTASVSLTLSRLPSPSLASSPTVVMPGALLTLRGSGFGATRGSTVVRVGGVPVEEYVSWMDTQVSVRVALAASPGASEVVVELGAQSWRKASAALHVLPQVTLSSGEFFSLGVRPDGTVAAWGDNYFGQTTVPPGLSDVVAVSANQGHGLALQRDGTVVAWGNNASGQATVPEGLSGVVAVSAGKAYSLALQRDGTVVAWGNNTSGQVTVPPGLSGVAAVSAGSTHNLALKQDGTVVAWGNNDFGRATVPKGLLEVVSVSAGSGHSLALQRDGTVVAWGFNDYGQASVPEGLSGVVAVSAGLFHSLALKQDGTVVAWGAGEPPRGLRLRTGR